jgi:hypothetical protein
MSRIMIRPTAEGFFSETGLPLNHILGNRASGSADSRKLGLWHTGLLEPLCPFPPSRPGFFSLPAREGWWPPKEERRPCLKDSAWVDVPRGRPCTRTLLRPLGLPIF